jgi:hypothetical protein
MPDFILSRAESTVVSGQIAADEIDAPVNSVQKQGPEFTWGSGIADKPAALSTVAERVGIELAC